MAASTANVAEILVARPLEVQFLEALVEVSFQSQMTLSHPKGHQVHLKLLEEYRQA